MRFLKLFKAIKTRSTIFNRVVFLYLMIFLVAFAITNKHNLFVSSAMPVNRMSPHPMDYLFQLSNDIKRYDSLKVEERVLYYKKLVQIFPNRADVRGTLAFCYFHLGEIDKAIASYEKAIELQGDFFWFYYNLGVIYFRQGDYDKASVFLNKASVTDPLRDFDIIYRNKVFQDIKENLHGTLPDPSAEMRKNYLKAKYDSLKIVLLARYNTGDYEKVLGHVRRELEYKGITKKNEAFYSYYGGLAALKLNKNRKATALFRKFLAHEPGNAKALSHLSEALKGLGYEEKAKEMLKQSLEILKTNSDNRYEEEEFYPRIF